MKIALLRLASVLLLVVSIAWGGVLYGEEVPPRQAIEVDSKVLDTYIGQYELAPKVVVALHRERRHFIAQITGQPPFEIFAESESKFFWKVVEAQFEIEKDKQGKVEGLLFQQGGMKMKARKISSELPKEVTLPEPDAAIESPRLLVLAGELKKENRDALQKFWDEMQDKAPLVEPVDGAARESWVTFLWRGGDQTRTVRMQGGLPTLDGEKWLTRLANTDLWYRTERVPNDARFAYFFQINRPLKMPHGGSLAVVAKVMELCPARLDPLNPREATLQGMLFSVVELPSAPSQPWVTRQPGVQHGELKEQKIKSDTLKAERIVTVYTPAGYDPKGAECGLLVLFDGAYYQDKDMIPAPVILDNLIAGKKIPPLVVVFVHHDAASRIKDLSCSEPFADFLVKELVPWVRSRYRTSADPQRAIVGGLSVGGLMAAYCGLRHPEVFGNVLSQSGAYWWYPGGVEQMMQSDRGLQKEEPGWLTRQFVAAPLRPVRFYLEAGRFEEGGGFTSICSESRRFRDVLQAKGYAVKYSEYNGGHDYISWRGSLADGLMTLTSK